MSEVVPALQILRRRFPFPWLLSAVVIAFASATRGSLVNRDLSVPSMTSPTCSLLLAGDPGAMLVT